MRAVVGQQISVAGARTILGRIAARYGTQIDRGDGEIDLVFPEPARLARVRVSSMPASRAATIRAIASAFACGEPTIDALRELSGIGPWTASYLAMRGYSQRDAFPSGDLGVRKAAGRISARELEQMSERWRPYRAYAAMLLWRSL
jgi:AraC family transcriptional regulator, regulatory protein of adaptative response / DNA-3-methyladenine glycosylase II